MKTVNSFIRLLVLSMAALLSLTLGVWADGETIVLPGSLPAELAEGYLKPSDHYPPHRTLHIKIHLADLGDDEKKIYETIADWLKNNGMKLGDIPKDRRTIEADTNVQTVEALFQISIDQYPINSLLYYANSQPPSIPVTLNGIITRIEGLDNFPTP